MTHLLIGGEKHLLEVETTHTSQLSMKVHQRHSLGALPSFVAFTEGRPLALCVAEGSGTLVSLSVEGAGRMSQLGSAHCPGGPAYVSFDRSGRWALTASYGSGEARIYAVGQRGELEPPASVLSTGKYSHCAVASPDNALVAVPSKGTDSIARIRFDESSGGAELLEPIDAPKGSGPRHLVFSGDGKRAYVSGENDCSLMVYRVSGIDFELLMHLPSLPGGQQEGDTGSDVHLSRDERFVYVSNRGSDSITCFSVTDEGAKLESVHSTHGKVPRNFCLIGEDQLVAANQESSTLSFFSRDVGSGALSYLGQVKTEEKPFWVGSRLSY